MLEPALAHEDELRKKLAYELTDPQRYKYLAANYIDMDVNLEKHTWNKIQFVSYYGGEVIGYMEADIHQFSKNKIYGLSVVRFSQTKQSSAVFGIDLMRYLKMLIKDYKAHKITFNAFDGNPKLEHYKRIVKRVGGRIVGVLKEDVALFDGTLVDKYIFEVMARDIPEHFLK